VPGVARGILKMLWKKIEFCEKKKFEFSADVSQEKLKCFLNKSSQFCPAVLSS